MTTCRFWNSVDDRSALADRLLSGLGVLQFNMEKMEGMVQINKDEAANYDRVAQELGLSALLLSKRQPSSPPGTRKQHQYHHARGGRGSRAT